MVRDFCDREVLPVADTWVAREEFPVEVIRKVGKLGIAGLRFPAAYGGSDGDMLSVLVALEELARGDASVAVTIDVSATLCGELLYRYGTEEQKRRWLAPIAQGEIIGSFALTEPEGGSDAASIRTAAVRHGNEWVINGSKAFITNAGTPLTGLTIVAAVTSRDGKGKAAISNFVVPSDAPGFSVGPAYHKLGWRASATRPLYFQDCRVPAANLLGVEGRGLAQFLWALDLGRVGLAAMAVGLMQACLDLSVGYAQKRRAFGKSIAAFQAVQFKLADMATAVHLGRLVTYHAGTLVQRGLPFKREAAIAKLFTSEAALRVVDEAVQVHGGYGFMEDSPVSRYYRDAKVLTIGEGTSEMQRLVIARELGCG
ncbi:MAG: acyl-CoA dehydrogenase family protein [Chloroflexi bacterium]|nr:acyl-CoA dehydrogenase family protein [Chloroflexota bacterium]